MPKIIVGVDQSDRSKDAIALASRLAAGADAELVLVNAFPYDTSPSRALNSEYESSLRDEANATLAALRAGIAAPNVSTVAVPEVSPAKAIQTIAEREHAALVVIGSSRRSQIGRVLASTTAERLLHGAPCPVLVTPNGFRERATAPIGTIAVGYNGSAEAESALHAATAVASAFGARLKVIEVINVMWSGTPALISGPGYIITPETLEEDAREHLAEFVDGLGHEVPVEPVLRVGDAEQLLAEESGGADLVVVGSRGYGPHRAVLLGSVSGRLVRDAACPVLVVPRGIGAPLEQLFPTSTHAQAV